MLLAQVIPEQIGVAFLWSVTALAIVMLLWDTIEVGRNDAANIVNAVFGARILTRERAVLVAGIGVVLLAALAVAYLAPGLYGAPLRANAPFAALAADIRALGFARGTILAESHYIAGNLKLHLPDVTVAEPEYGLWPLAEGGRTAPVLLVWSGKRDRPPQALRELYERLCGARGLDPEATPTRFREPYRHAPGERYELAVVTVPDCPSGGTP